MATFENKLIAFLSEREEEFSRGFNYWHEQLINSEKDSATPKIRLEYVKESMNRCKIMVEELHSMRLNIKYEKDYYNAIVEKS